MLASAARQYRQQKRIGDLALADLRRRKGRGLTAVVNGLTAYQLASIEVALEAGENALAEQGIEAPAIARVIPETLVSGPGARSLYAKAPSNLAFDQLTKTLVANAASTATTVDLGRRPFATGHIRSLSPPSCPRCAILAGRVYRYSQGFQRHPRCDCMMTLTTLRDGQSLVGDPMQAFRDGQIRGLSLADTQAINLGADISQVVNVRRKAAGLSDGSAVLTRAGRLTPHAIMRASATREEVIDLLRKFGYVTGEAAASREAQAAIVRTVKGTAKKPTTGGVQRAGQARRAEIASQNTPPATATGAGSGGAAKPPRAPGAAGSTPEPPLNLNAIWPDDFDDDLLGVDLGVVSEAFASRVNSVAKAHGLTWAPTVTVTETGRKLTIAGDLTDANGKNAGRLVRDIYRRYDQSVPGNYTWHVSNELFDITDAAYQGVGFATEVGQVMEAWYRELGVSDISVHANIDVGGYAWARAGFEFHPALSVRGMTEDLLGRILRVTPASDTESLRLLKDFGARLNGPVENWPTPYDLSKIGRPADAKGQKTWKVWPGKAGLLDSDWYGIKYL